jgi:hypothetical protein
MGDGGDGRCDSGWNGMAVGGAVWQGWQKWDGWQGWEGSGVRFPSSEVKFDFSLFLCSFLVSWLLFALLFPCFVLLCFASVFFCLFISFFLFLSFCCFSFLFFSCVRFLYFHVFIFSDLHIYIFSKYIAPV